MILRSVLQHNQSVVRSFARYRSMDAIRENLTNIFLKSVSAVNPKTLIENSVSINGNNLSICNKQYVLNNNCYIVGFGKAVFYMATKMESILGSHLVRGIVSVPVGMLSSDACRESSSGGSRLKFIEGAENNLPDTAAEMAARQIAKLIKKLGKDDLLIVLISGGGSALLPFPIPPLTLQEKSQLIKVLSNRGANIQELNCVRKRLSVLKGGGLAKLAHPATVVAMVLSDIMGDPLDCIASGPTAPNADRPDAAMEIIKKYALDDQLPPSTRLVLQDTTKTPDGSFSHVTNFVIGNNKLATSAAVEEARRLGYQACVISSAVCGDVAAISGAYARLAVETAKVMKGITSKEKLRELLAGIQPVLNVSAEAAEEFASLRFDGAGGVCVVAGGEPTVAVRGGGRGGRNQQLALQFSIDVNNAARGDVARMNISLLSCGTDGIDGPTDAAGALGFNGLPALAARQRIDPLHYLAHNDSYNFYNSFQNGQFLIRTGHTGTNVMDIHVLLIKNNHSTSLTSHL